MSRPSAAGCRAYDVAAATADPNLVGHHPTERRFHRWITGDMLGLPHIDHCAVLETMFPGYSARQLFEVAEHSEPARPEMPEKPAQHALRTGSGNANVLRILGWTAIAASVGCSLDPDEQARVARALSNRT